MEKNKKKGEQLANLKDTIRQSVEQSIRNKFRGEPQIKPHEKQDGLTVSFEVNAPSPRRQVAHETNRPTPDNGDSFWNLGKPKPRVYKKPDFAGAPVEMTDVADTVEVEYDVPAPEKIAGRAQPSGEIVKKDIYAKLKYRPADNTDPFDDIFGDISAETERKAPSEKKMSTATSDGRQTVVHDVPRYQTGSYKRQGGFHPQKKDKQKAEASGNPQKRRVVDEVLATYKPEGLLIREIEVKSWSSDIDFYERFMENAVSSHRAQSSVPYMSDYPKVKYFSYVPQYSHMSRTQLDFYRWVRENIRHERYPDCDSSYIQLYIYEILNLSDLIPPEYGAAQLAGMWLAYRKAEPRLDGYLCEWLPDYCMIHACPMPEMVKTILPEIVPKAQFKEFFLDVNPASAADADYLMLAKTLLETSSDYDYRRSRYYHDNRDAYEKHIHHAIADVVKGLLAAKLGIFSLEKTYKMARDSYCGAIVSVDAKRRMNIEFCSFTRSADTRATVTALVKYAENKLRASLGIKAKLGVDKLTEDETAIIDAYFAPMLPVKQVKSKEDQYMPDDYLKNYESEDSGFDFGTAAEIERQSWRNTTLLTGGEFDSEQGEPYRQYENSTPVESTAVSAEQEQHLDAALQMEKAEPMSDSEPMEEIEGEISSDLLGEMLEVAVDEPAVQAKSDEEDEFIRNALLQALSGRFHEYCRENGIYDGVLADRINTMFLDIIGDVVLEESGSSYTIIEDYREDIEQWTDSR